MFSVQAGAWFFCPREPHPACRLDSEHSLRNTPDTEAPISWWFDLALCTKIVHPGLLSRRSTTG